MRLMPFAIGLFLLALISACAYAPTWVLVACAVASYAAINFFRVQSRPSDAMTISAYLSGIALVPLLITVGVRVTGAHWSEITQWFSGIMQ